MAYNALIIKIKHPMRIQNLKHVRKRDNWIHYFKIIKPKRARHYIYLWLQLLGKNFANVFLISVLLYNNEELYMEHSFIKLGKLGKDWELGKLRTLRTLY